MSQKNSVEELLAELFTEEVSNPPNNLQESKADKYLIATDHFDNAVITFLTNGDLNEITDEHFHKLFRMNKKSVSEIQLEINGDNSDNQAFDTNLLLCLLVAGNTCPLHELSHILGINEEHINAICEKYFRKIIELSFKYVTWPTPCEMSTLESIFNNVYNFPSIIGAIGCLHIVIQTPENLPDCNDYYNTNSGHYTIVLQAVCDSNLLFRDIFVGYPGSKSVEEILNASPLNDKLMDEDGYLRKTNRHLLGGTEHPQLETLLTPYRFSEEKKLGARELKFNSRHGSAMLVVDKTFQLIENRFQRMKCLDGVDVGFATLGIGAICVLHNFTRIRNDNCF